MQYVPKSHLAEAMKEAAKAPLRAFELKNKLWELLRRKSDLKKELEEIQKSLEENYELYEQACRREDLQAEESHKRELEEREKVREAVGIRR